MSININGDSLLKYLHNQKRLGIELGAPLGEIDLIDCIIDKVNEMMNKNEY
jgi:hypothetical protein